ncbi:MAG: hypothetical protein NVS1B4_15680 [Gemmatimonadaceae bacterium]
MDVERIAAHIPPIIGAADELGEAADRGNLTTAILEHANGVALISVLSPEAILFVLLDPTANVGQLLFELRRNRQNIATLV